jgi:hypothetical protein
MTALHSFIQAAASYWGVPVDQLTHGSTIDATTGDIEVVLRVAVNQADLAGIAVRMQRMATEAAVDEAQAKPQVAYGPLTDGVLRTAYNGLPTAERSKHGSFAKFKAYMGAPDSWDYGQHRVDAINAGLLPGGPGNTTPEPVELPPHAYVPGRALTEQQKAMAVGMNERGEYAMDPADLTEQQRAQYGAGVTSNADDFGGLPG